ncbi:hypothetical protein CONLIGDRAFT_626465 [Coniochaeta ligniaria NRRL 30616]|uniref:Cleavage stimulation factor subunit 2 hinge domain-containing protein n=1 Tax=Coniochaeta ligniaria NRRL 30616 TaxID=1408157 RepID=A0A1J7J4Z9_9PEZI|nr:hypothetical protein CONLIGDRAFT_626465 [Coniochaeta ligniaria NRRL 30616]
MKQLATTDPARATELLSQAPQLSYAIFQALLLMGLVSPEAINSVVDTSAGVAPPPQAAAPPVQQQQQPQMPGYPGYPQQQPAFTNTPPLQVGGYAPPPMPQQQVQQAPPPQAAVAQDQAALMAAVMSLPQETIDQLPEAERAQVLALRASFGAPQR